VPVFVVKKKKKNLPGSGYLKTQNLEPPVPVFTKTRIKEPPGSTKGPEVVIQAVI
jgi:hypothetical protein